MQAMQIANGDIQYRFRGTPVCRTMWMRIYGVGRHTMARAKKLLRYSNSLIKRNYTPQTDVQDLVIVLLLRKFMDECETIADGIWHLQDTENFDEIVGYVQKNWQWACINLLVGERCHPGKSPGKGLVRRMWREHFKQVKPIRKGDFAKCSICSDLNEEHSRGFKNEAQALDWRARSYLHHKVHRRCREGSLRRAHEAAVCKDRVTAWTIDMTKNF
eukprot:g41821.t1